MQSLSDPKDNFLPTSATVTNATWFLVLSLQEPHCGFNNNCLKINGMTLVVGHPHEKYESAIFVKTGTIIESASIIDDNNIKILTTETDNY